MARLSLLNVLDRSHDIAKSFRLGRASFGVKAALTHDPKRVHLWVDVVCTGTRAEPFGKGLIFAVVGGVGVRFDGVLYLVQTPLQCPPPLGIVANNKRIVTALFSRVVEVTPGPDCCPVWVFGPQIDRYRLRGIRGPFRMHPVPVERRDVERVPGIDRVELRLCLRKQRPAKHARIDLVFRAVQITFELACYQA